MQIVDTQKFQLTADPQDAAGYDVDAAISFSVDNSAVASIVDVTLDDGTIDPKSKWIVSGQPGSAVVTVSVPTSEGNPDLTATLAVDVVPGGVAIVNLVAGDAVDK
ncbi:hypothetical protein [Nocardia sp. NBC_00511]|uniref:hypothetical protein n=1 Tax=Nocardia sp. NBC_00511 TaxID=2903591 RepID=UPI0030E2EAFC